MRGNRLGGVEDGGIAKEHESMGMNRKGERTWMSSEYVCLEVGHGIPRGKGESRPLALILYSIPLFGAVFGPCW